MSSDMVQQSNEIVFTPHEMEKIDQIAQDMDITNTQAVMEFGVEAQTQIADFSDAILQQVQVKDSGYVGEILSDLMGNIQNVDAGDLRVKKGGLFSSFRGRVKKFIARYQKLSTQIDDIVNNLETAQQQLMKDITLLDKMYEKNAAYIQELDVYIAAGKQCLQQIETEEIPRLLVVAEKSENPVDIQNARDMQANADRFDKKIGDLQLSRMVAVQSMPQMRMVQQNDQVLVERIQSSILNTIPLWKNQMVIAITILRQNAAVKLQREVTDTTNELLKKNAEMLKQGSIETAVEAERGIVELETLQQVNDELVETITEVIRIQKEGRAARAQVEVELKNMENNLKKKLLNIQQNAE